MGVHRKLQSSAGSCVVMHLRRLGTLVRESTRDAAPPAATYISANEMQSVTRLNVAHSVT